MRLQLANQAFGLMASLVSHGPSGHALSLVLRTRRIRPLRGLITKEFTKYRGPKDRSTQKSGPSGLDFWVRLAFGQAQNKSQRVRGEAEYRGLRPLYPK